MLYTVIPFCTRFSLKWNMSGTFNSLPLAWSPFPSPNLPSLLRASCLFWSRGFLRIRRAMVLFAPLFLHCSWLFLLLVRATKHFVTPEDFLIFSVCPSRELSNRRGFLPFPACVLRLASLGLGVKVPSSSVCLSKEVPVLNPAGSSSVSQAFWNFLKIWRVFPSPLRF